TGPHHRSCPGGEPHDRRHPEPTPSGGRESVDSRNGDRSSTSPSTVLRAEDGCYGSSKMDVGRGRRRVVVAPGGGALAPVGALGAAVVVRSHDGGAEQPTTGGFAAITVSRPKLHTTAGSLVSDPEAGVQNNLYATVSQLPGRYRYSVEVTNTS